jgi:2-deoxy-D-gluconate 3-dehydrogenase
MAGENQTFGIWTRWRWAICGERRGRMILDAFKLEGKVAIVTGSSTGLGRGMSLALAEAGADIVGVDYVGSKETGGEVEARGRRYEEVEADLMTIGPVGGIVERAVGAFGAGGHFGEQCGDHSEGDALAFTEKDWDEVMDLNAKTVFFLSQAVARRYKEQGGGGRSSTLRRCCRFRGDTGAVVYGVEECGDGLTRLLANDGRSMGSM